MKKFIVSFSSLPTITQGTSPTHRPIFAYRKPFRIARLSGVARGPQGPCPPQTFGKCFFVALTKVNMEKITDVLIPCKLSGT